MVGYRLVYYLPFGISTMQPMPRVCTQCSATRQLKETQTYIHVKFKIIIVKFKIF